MCRVFRKHPRIWCIAEGLTKLTDSYFMSGYDLLQGKDAKYLPLSSARYLQEVISDNIHEALPNWEGQPNFPGGEQSCIGAFLNRPDWLINCPCGWKRSSSPPPQKSGWHHIVQGPTMRHFVSKTIMWVPRIPSWNTKIFSSLGNFRGSEITIQEPGMKTRYLFGQHQILCYTFFFKGYVYLEQL